MRVTLTGATGFIGSHVLAELQEHSHEVTTLVRNEADAETVGAKGATPVVVDLNDRPAVVSALRDADGAIHTASPGDETSAGLDSAVVDAAIEAFDGTGKPYLHITGAWLYGANPSITEKSPIDAPAMVAWKEPIAQRALDAGDMRGVVIAPGVAYGDGGGGVPGLLLGSPRDDAGNLIMLGTGRQHWATVHVADLANFFRRALENDSARGHYVVGDGLEPDRCGVDRGGGRRSRRSGGRPGLRRRGSGPLGRLLRRSAPARPGNRRGQGQGRSRLVPVTSRARRRLPRRQLPQRRRKPMSTVACELQRDWAQEETVKSGG